uniref:Uncharacterized protein n=1 Tax=Anguilla anguilla TaxID=7936 RepID=A0A0E9RS73_ANGAN
MYTHRGTHTHTYMYVHTHRHTHTQTHTVYAALSFPLAVLRFFILWPVFLTEVSAWPFRR